MLRLTRKPTLFVIASALALLFSLGVEAQTAAPNTPTPSVKPAASGGAKLASKRSASKGGKKTPEPQITQAPPPSTPEQMPPLAPTVSYQSGQLTIESQNATLAQVLRSVQIKTGASFDIPPSAGNERVVAHLGPGRPSDVLASLLSGSKFDYIILGSPNQPGTVQKLILTPRQNTPAAVNTAQSRPSQPPPGQEPSPEDDYAQPEPSPESNAAADNENQNQQPQGPGGFRPGAYIPNQNQNGEFPAQQPPQQGSPDAQAPQSQPGAKTPEQLLQELQRMQQQQQMYQQQLNPANQNPPPQEQQQQ
jgi:hypothetical protein